MKFVVSQLSYFFRLPEAQRNARTLLKFIGVLVLAMIAFSILFHFIAISEGQEHSWLSGFYWTVVTMTPLDSATSPSRVIWGGCSPYSFCSRVSSSCW